MIIMIIINNDTEHIYHDDTLFKGMNIHLYQLFCVEQG